MVALREHSCVGEELERLAAALEDLDFGYGAQDLAEERDRLVGTIRSYLVPRVLDPTGPLTVVVAGPTGSGKSTLVNSLTGLDASRTGALRPTTSVPVVVTRFERAREYETIGAVGCEVVPAPPGSPLDDMVIVDTPDIDSTSTDHRAIAEELIDNADVVIFVTSALRYADEVPWQVLRRAESRGTPVIHVLNRVESASAGSIVDFESRLTAAGFDGDLITVSEHHLAEDAVRVPELAVRSLRKRLDAVVADREEFAGEVFSRVGRSTVTRTQALVRSIADIQDEIDALEARADLDLIERLLRLDLHGVASGLYPEPPSGGFLSRLRWMRSARRERPEAGVVEEAVADRLVHVVDADVRRWLVEEGAALRHAGVDVPHVVDGVLASARSAAEGWVDYVGRIAADFDDRNVWLCEATLLETAIDDTQTRAMALLFGDDGPALAERARRELLGRLQVVYEHAATLVADGLRRRYGDIDDSELRIVLGAATAVLAPVDA